MNNSRPPRIRNIHGAVQSAAAGPESLPELLAALHHRKEKVRRAAAWALGELRHPDAVPDLLAALYDPDALVRHNCLGALRKIGAAGAAPRVAQVLQDSDPNLRCEAARTLYALAPLEAARLLPPLCTDDACTSLPRFGGQTVGAVIRGILREGPLPDADA